MSNPNERNRTVTRFIHDGGEYLIHERSNRLSDGTWFKRRFIVRTRDNRHMGDTRGVKEARQTLNEINGNVRPFRVAALSDNRNSFGLTGVVLMDREGNAFEVAMSDPPDLGTDVTARMSGEMVIPSIHLMFEIPRKMPKAPKKVVDELYKPKTY